MEIWISFLLCFLQNRWWSLWRIHANPWFPHLIASSEIQTVCLRRAAQAHESPEAAIQADWSPEASAHTDPEASAHTDPEVTQTHPATQVKMRKRSPDCSWHLGKVKELLIRMNVFRFLYSYVVNARMFVRVRTKVKQRNSWSISGSYMYETVPDLYVWLCSQRWEEWDISGTVCLSKVTVTPECILYVIRQG